MNVRSFKNMSPRTPEQNKVLRQDSQTRIIASALKLFAEHGYSATSIKMIAQEANLAQGLLYNYFSGKEELLRAIFAQSMTDVRESFALAEGDTASNSTVAGVIRAALTLVARKRDFWRLSYGSRMQPALLTVLGDDLFAWTQEIRNTLERYFRTSGAAQPEIEAAILFALIDGVAQHYVLDPEHYPLAEVTETIVARYSMGEPSIGLNLVLQRDLACCRVSTPSPCHPESNVMSTPTWLDRTLYPFADHWFDVPAGEMHYVDEGTGPAVVFVHGTPTWSFLYRRQISALRTRFRCIAADNIGFGLSAKPPGWSYTPVEHAANLAALLDHLQLERFTLVVHDLGGPLGLSYALDHPERIERLVIINTLLWGMHGEFAMPAAGRILTGPLGKWLYLQHNLSPRMLLPMLFADRSVLTPTIHHHYTAPFAIPSERHGLWGWVLALRDHVDWFDGLWSRRERLTDIPGRLVWGMKDSAFGPHYLRHWQRHFPQWPSYEIANCSHFVAEEAAPDLIDAIKGMSSICDEFRVQRGGL
ncbi:alpha/beta fold hydrolase [Candidatus Gracilibacteria bacterium]|nr:alpha/beta fold hydrolase [Candidatus Gracilibacteria bacterium]